MILTISECVGERPKHGSTKTAFRILGSSLPPSPARRRQSRSEPQPVLAGVAWERPSLARVCEPLPIILVDPDPEDEANVHPC